MHHTLLRLLRQNYMFFKLFFYVEEAEWAIEVMKATGKPVAMCMCVCTAGDMEEVPIDECAVRIAKAGTRNFFQIFMHQLRKMLSGSANTASDPVIPTYIFAQSRNSDGYFNFRQSHIPRTLFPNLASCFNPFAPEPPKNTRARDPFYRL